jgi:hypothetical protein
MIMGGGFWWRFLVGGGLWWVVVFAVSHFLLFLTLCSAIGGGLCYP